MTSPNQRSEGNEARGSGFCPPILACNLIKTQSGTPLCGIRLGQLAAVKDETRKEMQMIGLEQQLIDADKMDYEQVELQQTPYDLMMLGNPYCRLCVDIFNALQILRSAQKEDLKNEIEELERTKASAICALQPSALQVRLNYYKHF